MSALLAPPRPVVRAHRHATRAPIAAAGAALGMCAAVNLVDPNEPGSWGTCPFLALTGRPCPGCGSLRAIRALTRGDVVAAVGLNALLVVLVPALLWAWWRWWSSARQGVARLPSVPVAAGYAIAAAVPLFALARNLPWLAALAP